MKRLLATKIVDDGREIPVTYRVFDDMVGVYGRQLPDWLGTVERGDEYYDDVALLTPSCKWYEEARKAGSIYEKEQSEKRAREDARAKKELDEWFKEMEMALRRCALSLTVITFRMGPAS